MLSFKQIFHDEIKAGNITVSFKDWKTLNVQKNKIYKSANLGLLRVLDVGFLRLSDIPLSEIRKSGFRSFRAFRSSFEENARRPVDFQSGSAVKIEFEYLGKDIVDKKTLRGKVTPLELFELRHRIIELDEKSGPPGVIMSLLLLKEKGPLRLEEVGQSVQARPDSLRGALLKLKEMGVLSSNVRRCYALTPLGVKILDVLTKEIKNWP